MTQQQRPSDVPALLARLLTQPHLLDAVLGGDVALVREHVDAAPEDLAVLAGLDTSALRHYLRGLQRKRLTSIEPIFPASLAAARTRYGADALAAEFWPWCQPPATVPASEVLAETVRAWTRFAGHLAQEGPPDWLGELSRYEAMRWQAAVLAEPPVDGSGPPVLAPGTGLGSFAVDVTRLPVVSRTPIHLIVWGQPAGGVRTARLGRAAYEAVGRCDGIHTVEGIAAAAGVRDGRDRAAARRVAAMLVELLRAGALHRSAIAQVPAERQHSGPVQVPDHR